MAPFSEMMPFLLESVKMAVVDSGFLFMFLPEQKETLPRPCLAAQHPLPHFADTLLVRESKARELLP